MTPQLSVFLDLVRFAAAVWVAMAHLRMTKLSALDWVPSGGRDAVVIFFVLSGFVIAHAARCRPCFRDYAVARLARIYSVALPVLLLTVALDLIAVAWLEHGHYPLYQYGKLWLYLPFQALFLNEIWGFGEQAFSNVAYWSLGYEVWYYVIFAALSFLRGGMRVTAVLLLLAAVGPKLWILWPVWLLGAWLYSGIDRLTLGRTHARLLCLGAAALYIGYAVSGADDLLRRLPSDLIFGTYGQSPLGSAKQFLSDYVVAVLFAASVLGFRWSAWSLPAPHAIAACAGYTFTLYLLHVPVLFFIRALGVVDPLSAWHTAAVLATVGFATLLIAPLTEHRKRAWERLFERLVDHLPTRFATARLERYARGSKRGSAPAQKHSAGIGVRTR